MSDPRIAELIDLAQRHAQEREGHFVSALPGLSLYRFERTTLPVTRKRAPHMFLSVALLGQKRMRLGQLTFLYDRLNYLVVRGGADYEGSPVSASREQPYLALVLALPPELVMRTLLEVPDAGDTAPTLDVLPAFQGPLDAPLTDALCRLLRTLDNQLERRVLAPLVLNEIVFRLLQSPAAALLRQGLGKREERARINEALQYIREHAHQKLSVPALAKRAAMSPSHFAHRFREIASVSPMRYQKHVRMENARELLLTRGERSATIAARVGYLSEAQFTRDFKRHFGLAPATYARAFTHGATHALGPAPLFAGSSKKSAEPALGARRAAG